MKFVKAMRKKREKKEWNHEFFRNIFSCLVVCPSWRWDIFEENLRYSRWTFEISSIQLGLIVYVSRWPKKWWWRGAMGTYTTWRGSASRKNLVMRAMMSKPIDMGSNSSRREKFPLPLLDTTKFSGCLTICSTVEFFNFFFNSSSSSSDGSGDFSTFLSFFFRFLSKFSQFSGAFISVPMILPLPRPPRGRLFSTTEEF